MLLQIEVLSKESEDRTMVQDIIIKSILPVERA